jgi:general secretion pathway protein A
LSNPTLTRDEFIKYAAWKLGFGEIASFSKADFLIALERLLEQHREQRMPVALVVDEAHTLSDGLLEEIRLIANYQQDDANLISVVLSGQPELAERLNSSALRQIKQRVALRCTLRAFTVDETAAYIAGRTRVAGGQSARLFSREAVAAIHEASGGIPRTINVICDNALIAGFAMDQRPVRQDIVFEVCRDLDLRRLVSHPPAVDAPVPAIPSEVDPDTDTPAANPPTADATILTNWIKRPYFSRR